MLSTGGCILTMRMQRGNYVQWARGAFPQDDDVRKPCIRGHAIVDLVILCYLDISVDTFREEFVVTMTPGSV